MFPPGSYPYGAAQAAAAAAAAQYAAAGGHQLPNNASGSAAAWRRRHPPARHRRVDAGVLAGADDRGAGRGDQHGGLQEPPAAAGEDQKGSKVLFVCSSLSLLSLSFFLFPHSPLSRALFSSLFSLPVRKPLFRS